MEGGDVLQILIVNAKQSYEVICCASVTSIMSQNTALSSPVSNAQVIMSLQFFCLFTILAAMVIATTSVSSVSSSVVLLHFHLLHPPALTVDSAASFPPRPLSISFYL